MCSARILPVSTAFVRPLHWAVLARYASIVLSCVLLTGCLSDDAGIGVVDSVSIVQDGEPGRTALAHLAQVREVLGNNFSAVSKKLEGYPDTQQAQDILQASQQALQSMLQTHEQQVNAQLTALLQSSVRECRTAKKLTAMFTKNSLLDYDPALDVSADVLALFDKKTLQLPPVPVLVPDPPLPAPLNAAVGAQPAVTPKPAVGGKPKAPALSKAEERKTPQAPDATRRK